MGTKRAKPTVRSHVLGAGLGVALAPVFAIASALRRKRAVHPYGGAYVASVVVTHPLPSLTGTALGRVDRFAGIVRLSHGLGKGPGRPDVRGFALRLVDHGGLFKQDILMVSATTSRGRQLIKQSTAYTTRFSSVVPLVAPQGPIVFTCLPMESGASDEYFDRGQAVGFRFQLSAGKPHDTPYPCADIVFERALDPAENEALRFNPFNADLGLAPVSVINVIRRVVYPASQLGRGAWSDQLIDLFPTYGDRPDAGDQAQASEASAARPGIR